MAWQGCPKGKECLDGDNRSRRIIAGGLLAAIGLAGGILARANDAAAPRT